MLRAGHRFRLTPCFGINSQPRRPPVHVRFLSVSTRRLEAAQSAAAAAAASSHVGTKEELVLGYLPEAPPKPTVSLDAIPPAEVVLDPPLQALGLGSWSPPGRVQCLIDLIHTHSGFGWCGTIFVTTLFFRMLVFPLVVISQRNVARLNNNSPQMQSLQEKMSDARRRGDSYDSSRYGSEMQKFMEEKDINPLKNMIPILGQFPIFLSMFVGLRGLANLPLESFITGGTLWFPDLTIPDPYYGLPLLTSLSLFLQFKVAADGASLEGAGPIAKVALRVMPVLLFPMTMNFPAAITFYWVSTNLISIMQARLIRTKRLRRALGIPELIKWDKKRLPAQNKGTMQTIRETMDNWKVQADISDRRKADEQLFRDVGTAKPRRTFKFDPTKPRRAV